MLAIQNLCKSYVYGDVRQTVLDGLCFDMREASSVALLGESGSGKSTLLHLIAGLSAPTVVKSCLPAIVCTRRRKRRSRQCAAPNSASCSSSFT